MEQRVIGRINQQVSVVGLGTWQLGADWGEVEEEDALATWPLRRRTSTVFGAAGSGGQPLLQEPARSLNSSYGRA